jgi:hypothetical protein
VITPPRCSREPIASAHQTSHSNGSQVSKSGIQECDFVQWYPGGDK